MPKNAKPFVSYAKDRKEKTKLKRAKNSGADHATVEGGVIRRGTRQPQNPQPHDPYAGAL
jgi:hypothetical protein